MLGRRVWWWWGGGLLLPSGRPEKAGLERFQGDMLRKEKTHNNNERERERERLSAPPGPTRPRQVLTGTRLKRKHTNKT